MGQTLTLAEYVRHYVTGMNFVFFLAVSFGVVLLIHIILLLRAKSVAGEYVEEDQAAALRLHAGQLTEEYDELVFSAASVLFFTGLYFLIDWNYFHLSSGGVAFWKKYNDFLLLGFLIVSMLLNNVLDRLFVPLRRLGDETRSSLRMAGMLYMMVVFAYIKFIYEDNNYDTIILYFLTMIIGRFVYFDASLADFRKAMKQLGAVLPILALVLLSTALLAWFGFRSGYLLKSNGVVVSLWIAHLILILEIFVIDRTGLMNRLAGRAARKLERTDSFENPASDYGYEEEPQDSPAGRTDRRAYGQHRYQRPGGQSGYH